MAIGKSLNLREVLVLISYPASKGDLALFTNGDECFEIQLVEGAIEVQCTPK